MSVKYFKVCLVFVVAVLISIRAISEEFELDIDQGKTVSIEERSPSASYKSSQRSKNKRKRKKKPYKDSTENFEEQPLFRKKSGTSINNSDELRKSNDSEANKVYDANGKSKVSTAHDQFTRDRGKLGFTNFFYMAYTNSVYQPEGDNYPVRIANFVLAPWYESTCFTLYCIYALRVVGLFDLNDNGKNSLRLFQFTLRFPAELWGEYFAPEYGLRLFLPATPSEINDTKMTFGYGAVFILATTPKLLGTDFYKLSVGFSVRKDNYNTPIEKQREWITRSGLGVDFKFSESLFANLIFAYYYGYYYDQTFLETKEFIQTFRWKANSWLDLYISHDNTEPINTAENNSRNYDLVSIKSSSYSVGFSITNAF